MPVCRIFLCSYQLGSSCNLNLPYITRIKPLVVVVSRVPEILASPRRPLPARERKSPLEQLSHPRAAILLQLTLPGDNHCSWKFGITKMHRILDLFLGSSLEPHLINLIPILAKLFTVIVFISSLFIKCMFSCYQPNSIPNGGDREPLCLFRLISVAQ